MALASMLVMTMGMIIIAARNNMPTPLPEPIPLYLAPKPVFPQYAGPWPATMINPTPLPGTVLALIT